MTRVIPTLKILVLPSVVDGHSKDVNAKDEFCQMSRLGSPFEMIRMIWFLCGCGSALKRWLKGRRRARLRSRMGVQARTRVLTKTFQSPKAGRLSAPRVNHRQVKQTASENPGEVFVLPSGAHLIAPVPLEFFFFFFFLAFFTAFFCS